MSNPPPHSSSGNQDRSLQGLLTVIEQEIVSSMAQDMAFLKERAERAFRKRKPFISFELGDDELALAIECIQEIGHLSTITPLPNLPSWIKGIVQIRGEILSVVDLLALFTRSRGASYATVNPSYLLYRHEDFKCCFMVKRVTGIIHLDEKRNQRIPPSVEQVSRLDRLIEFFQGVYVVDSKKVCILDGERMGRSASIRKWQ